MVYSTLWTIFTFSFSLICGIILVSLSPLGIRKPDADLPYWAVDMESESCVFGCLFTYLSVSDYPKSSSTKNGAIWIYLKSGKGKITIFWIILNPGFVKLPLSQSSENPWLEKMAYPNHWNIREIGSDVYWKADGTGDGSRHCSSLHTLSVKILPSLTTRLPATAHVLVKDFGP